MKTFRKGLAVILALALCLSVFALSVGADTQLVLEAENALAEGTFAGMFGPVDSPVETDDTASGGARVGYMSAAGNSLTWNIVADAAGTADLSLVLASCVHTMEMDATWALTKLIHEDFSLEGAIAITVNGAAIDLTGLKAQGLGDVLASHGATYGCYNHYVEVSLGNVALAEGENAVVLTVLDGTTSANYDCLKISNATVNVSEGTPTAGGDAPSVEQVTYEAEDALTEGTFAGMWGEVDSPVEDNENASGGKSVGYMSAAGNKITWTVTMEQDCTTDLALSLASCVHTMEMDDTWALTKLIHEDFVLSGAVSVTVNGAELDLTGLKVSGLGDILATHGATWGCYDHFQDVVIEDVALTAGENVIVYTVLDGTTSANVDCLKVGDYTGTSGGTTGGTTGGAAELVGTYEAEDADLSNAVSSYEGYEMIESKESASGGKSVGFFSVNGNKIVWNVEVANAGDYTLDFVLASAAMDYTTWGNADMTLSGDCVSITVNGEAVTVPAQVLPAGNYENWQDVLIEVSLNAGANEIALEIVDSSGTPNIDCLKVYQGHGVSLGGGTSGGSTGGQSGTTIRMEAEDAILDCESSLASWGYTSNIYDSQYGASGGKCLAYMAVVGNKVTWTFTATEAGTVTLTLNLASGAMDESYNNLESILADDAKITLNGSELSLADIVLPGGPQSGENWTLVTLTADVAAGENTVVLEILSTNGPNVDYLEVSHESIVFTDTCSGSGSAGGEQGGEQGGDWGGDWGDEGDDPAEEEPGGDTVFVPGGAKAEPNVALATVLAAVIGAVVALVIVLLITGGDKKLLAVIITTVIVAAVVCGYIAKLIVSNVDIADVDAFNNILLPTALAAVIGGVVGLAIVLLITRGDRKMLAVIVTVAVVCAAVCGYITNLITANAPAEDAEGVEKPTYTMVINGYDWGPGVDKLILDVGGEVSSVEGVSFGVSVSYQSWMGASDADREISKVYLCDEKGNAVESASRYIALEMPTDYNVSGGNPFYYDFMAGLNNWSNPYTYTVTMTSGSLKLEEGTYTALKVTNCAGKISPVADQFRMDSGTYEGIELHYAAYEPEDLADDGVKNALIIWLHGAGEGGTDPYIDILGNRVTALAEEEIQSCFDGNGAYVLTPQSPTMWMDNGSGEYTTESKSMYTQALKKLIDEYVAGNPDVDPNRIIIGGCSNGGFMTMNMILSYPDYFAAAYPICEAYYDANITDDMLSSIKDLSIWFTHAANDTTVDPAGTTVATYNRLIAMGAKNVYYTEWENVVDSQGVEQMGHWSWIYTLNNDCTETINGTETSIWAWLAQQSK